MNMHADLSRFALRSPLSRKLICTVAIPPAIASLMLFFLAISFAHAGDPIFGEPRFFGSGSDDSMGLAVGDVDGDGDLDLAVGNYSQQNIVYLNEGNGNFYAERPFGTGSDGTRAVAVGDVDGDGILDLVVADSAQSVVYLNDGAGGFYSGTVDCATPPDDVKCFGTQAYNLDLGDVDGDGALDIVAGKSGREQVYLNDGTGSFPISRTLGTGSGSADVAVGDMNGDGALDIVVGRSGQNVVYINDGTGDFPITRTFGTGSDTTYAVAVGDVNGDGILDAIVANQGQQSVVYLNNGSTFFDTRDFGAPTIYASSMTVGDLNGDGAIDIVVDCWGEQNIAYLNDGDGDFGTSVDFGTGSDHDENVALGDLNNDGALDVIVNNDEQNVVYLNDGVGDFTTIRNFGTGSDWTTALAVGDVDGDSDLDMIVGNGNLPGSGMPSRQNRVYLNNGAGNFPTYVGFGPITDDDPSTQSLAVGDMNNDDHLDIVVGDEGGQDAVYLNNGAGSFPISCTFGAGSDRTRSVAVGDVDGDGNLDAIVGNSSYSGGYGVIYVGDGSCHFPVTRTFGTGSDRTYSVALGDVDGDGDLDIVAGNYQRQNAVYLNDGAGHFGVVRPFGTGADYTRSVALGDIDGDGDLDIAIGNARAPGGDQNKIYLNDGAGNFGVVRIFGTGSDATQGVVLGDIDGDGDLDIVLANGHWGGDGDGEQNKVYLNDGTGQFGWATPARDFGANSSRTYSVVVGDLNGDGTLDIAAGTFQGQNQVYLNRIRRPARLASNPPSVVVVRPGRAADANFYSTPEVIDRVTIPVTYTLFDFDGDPVGHIAAAYSLDGGGRWLPAVAADGTVTADRPASAGGTSHVFTWDTFASGFFGQSDNVVFRIEAYPSLHPYTDTTPGPYQWPYAAATTFPFRVRGTQVRVLRGTAPISGAIVYRIPVGQPRGGRPFVDGSSEPYRTDGYGYLPGRGELGVGDGLVALLPISYTDSYTLYHTSAVPISTGLEAHTVISPGVQTLVVSSTHPLVLFNLEVSLQWDARNDGLYMSQLEYDLQRTSELLYDWTDGQLALGEVRVTHERERWNDAHVRVYATNRLRPNAAQGGVVSEVISDTDVISLTYGPGQVNMGAVWNRYGETGGGIGEDWPRTLAHELGHYLLFLDDNYIGLDENGLIISVEACTGAMGDPYRQDYPYDEFHADDVAWQETCTQTLSHQTTGRADWATIEGFYPWLNAGGANDGPSTLPLAVTEIGVVEPSTATAALDDPTFYLTDETGERVQPGDDARAFLFQDDYVIDLGKPTQDTVLARGARPDVGDRLCVFEMEAGRLGCEAVTSGDEQLEMERVAGWQPDLAISPITSRTIEITVTNVVSGLVMVGRLYPMDGSATDAITLTERVDGYAGVFTASEPAMAGYVHVQVVSPPAPLREVVTDYALGGNPGYSRAGRAGYMRSRQAPAMSADGQVILFGDLEFDEGEFFTLQAATVVPEVPGWATVVGQAYRLIGSDNAPELGGASISFAYLGSDVPEGEEGWIKVYYQGGLSETWELLPTVLDKYHNTASGPVRGEGLYVLMSSLEIALRKAGWNLISYPVEGRRVVTEALLSIDGVYTTVYGYKETDEADPWKVYDVGAPEWVNDLRELEFGRGYWINVSEALTLYLRGSSYEMAGASGGFPYPPATYYGRVLEGASFEPTAGMSVTARVGGKVCGQGVLTEVLGYGVAYAVNVMAEDWGEYGGCGAPGREVVFWVGDEEMVPVVGWDNRELEEVNLRPLWRVHLPMVMQQYVHAPDLVVEELVATSESITVVIKNRGPAPTRESFWVDVYVDPSPAPSGVNQTWPMLAEEGLVWGVTAPVQPGEVLTLTVGGAYYWAEHSEFSGGLAAGTWVYAQVDSVGEGTAHGAVLETHEIKSDPYNNIASLRFVVTNKVSQAGRPGRQ